MASNGDHVIKKDESGDSHVGGQRRKEEWSPGSEVERQD